MSLIRGSNESTGHGALKWGNGKSELSTQAVIKTLQPHLLKLCRYRLLRMFRTDNNEIFVIVQKQ